MTTSRTDGDREADRRYKAKMRAKRDMWRNFYAWMRPEGMAELIGQIRRERIDGD